MIPPPGKLVPEPAASKVASTDWTAPREAAEAAVGASLGAPAAGLAADAFGAGAAPVAPDERPAESMTGAFAHEAAHAEAVAARRTASGRGYLSLPEATAKRSAEDIIDVPQLVVRGQDQRRETYDVEIEPRLLVAGQKNVEVSIDLRGEEERRHVGRDIRRVRPGYRFRKGDGFALVDAQGKAIPLQNVRVHWGKLTATLPEVTAEMAGTKSLRLDLKDPATGHAERVEIPAAARVTDKVRIALTFDDGPSIESFREGTPTSHVLDVLKENGIAAAFFVLTGPDELRLPWAKGHFEKAETGEGFALLRREAREGHLIGVHWGGDYVSQHVTHPARLKDPAYDVDGDNVPDGATALESDLTQCKNRIREALGDEGDTSPVEFVRSPLWTYASKEGDARPTYDKLGLKMINSDAKLSDGGYGPAGMTLNNMMNRAIGHAIELGIASPIVTMHDSNPDTAEDIEMVIESTRKYMEGLGYSPEQWEFVGDKATLTRILHERERFLIEKKPPQP